MEPSAFQDQIPGNHCFGCGPDNGQGLGIRSFWKGPDTAVCRFRPLPHHNAGPRDYVNGGIISTVIDCHCVCTAIAKAYEDEERPIGAGEAIWYATGELKVRFLRPALMAEELVLEAQVKAVEGRKTRLACSVMSGGALAAEGEVLAIRVKADWAGG